MLDIQRVLNQGRLLRALTGLNRKAFEAMLDSFSPLYEQSCWQPRQRAVGGGRKARLLSSQEKLFFILGWVEGDD